MDKQSLIEIWEAHLASEFVAKDAEAALNTMTEDAYVSCIPSMTGGYSKEAVRNFYCHHFIGKVPPDMQITLVSRTVGEDQLVDEMIWGFTHTEEIPFMLPGVSPTNKYVEVPGIAIVKFHEGKIANERIYWDQASVLKQIGLITDPTLPIFGAETAQKVVNPSGNQSTKEVSCSL